MSHGGVVWLFVVSHVIHVYTYMYMYMYVYMYLGLSMKLSCGGIVWLFECDTWSYITCIVLWGC